MARFGDRRTYIYQGRAVDQQVHQGEDLANLVATPVPSANKGVVLLAEPLGIYGQTVLVDHGLGVCSMYSHLSQMDVKVGDAVEKGKVVGKTGATGLAGGDHLHFSMVVGGTFVDPLEWWDPKWIKDQVELVWVKAAGPESGQASLQELGGKKGKRQGARGKRKTNR
jgi:murein DD-endopeptidase MepM/ murein hydrolase activator NlpD